MTDLWDWLGLSGVAATIGGLLGYGKLQQKIVTLEQHATNMATVKETLARIDERTITLQRAIDKLTGDER